MRIVIRLACAMALMTALQSAAQLVVKTEAGRVGGFGSGVRVWKGIPYAQAPVGDLRWKAPLPPVAWQGVRPALKFGSICAQGSPTDPHAEMSEDCLTINVWSEAKVGEKLPVFVWIHGGGFITESGRINGEPLARSGIVVVSFNYRLGMFGFLAHPELTRESPHHASGNYGLLDQIAALRWVQRNVAAFGGDPTQVTIGGSSAGGTSVAYLVASPLAKGLFRGAMLDSAARLFLPDHGLKDTLHGLTPMEQAGMEIAPHIKDLRALSTTEVIARVEHVTDAFFSDEGRGRTGLKPGSHVHLASRHDQPWWAFVDGYVMPAELSRMFASGRFNHVAMMIGTCRDEGLGYALRMQDLTVGEYHDYLRKYYPAISEKMLTMYPAGTTQEIHYAVSRSITDSMFLYGSMRVADYESTAGAPVFVERFTRVPTGAPGVLHGTDDVYFLGDVRAGEGKYDADDERLSARMMPRLAAFVKTLNPNSGQPSPEWPAWTQQDRQYLEIGDQLQSHSFQDQAIIDLFGEQYERLKE